MTTPSIAKRLERLRASFEDIDALLVTELANVRYLTGFSGSAGIVVIGDHGTLLATDGRYRTQAGEQLEASGLASAVELAVGGMKAQRQAIAGALSGAGRVGIEAEHVSWAARERWAELTEPAELVATSGMVETLREVKDEGEVESIARACAIADEALGRVVGMLREGVTENEVAIELDSAMRRLGAEDRAFETIVASGPNSAKPHARPSDRPMRAGETVVIDFGATWEGYRSDMTRTFFVAGAPAVGSPGAPRRAGRDLSDSADRMREVYDLVAAAQQAGLEALGPGVAAGVVDRACRAMIAEAGYGEAFEHSTGHGVGLDIHEAPTVADGSTAILSPGVVATVEPGIYLPGVGGVRIEDTAVITPTGNRPLTSFPKDPDGRNHQ